MSILRRLCAWLFDHQVPCEHPCPEQATHYDPVLDVRACAEHDQQEVPG